MNREIDPTALAVFINATLIREDHYPKWIREDLRDAIPVHGVIVHNDPTDPDYVLVALNYGEQVPFAKIAYCNLDPANTGGLGAKSAIINADGTWEPDGDELLRSLGLGDIEAA